MRYALLALGLLAACGPPRPLTPFEVEARCQERASRAAAPTGSVAVGVSSNRGVQTGISIGITDDFIRGRDPALVYAECYTELTGSAPLARPDPAMEDL